MYESAPYKMVLTHGFTVDAQGRKMSKSLGNVVAPSKVIDSLGADILRLWVASTDYKNEIHVSDEILTRMGDAYRRIRNTARFILANLEDFDPTQHLVPIDQCLALDVWIISQAKKLQTEIIAAYDNYQFHLIYQLIHNFCVNELGAFYLDIIKDRQYTTQKESLIRRSAQTALYHIGEALVRWLAPILSFTAQELWGYMPKASQGERLNSVFLSEWYADFPEHPLSESVLMNDVFWQDVMSVRTEVNKALESVRAAGKIGAPLEAQVILHADKALFSVLSHLKDELRFVLITSGAFVLPLDTSSTAEWVATGRKDLFLEINPLTHEKCIRCWHRRSDVNQNVEYPSICDRCVTNVMSTGTGEERQYV